MKKVVATGFAVLTPSIGAGVAQAAHDTAALVNTKCSHDQIVNAEVPDEASGINSSSQLQGLLHDFVAAPASQRQSMADEAMANFFLSDDMGAFIRVAGTCNKY